MTKKISQVLPEGQRVRVGRRGPKRFTGCIRAGLYLWEDDLEWLAQHPNQNTSLVVRALIRVYRHACSSDPAKTFMLLREVNAEIEEDIRLHNSQ